MELDSVHERIKKWLLTPTKGSTALSNTRGGDTLQSLKARRDDIEEQLIALQSAIEISPSVQDTPAPFPVPVPVPPPSANEISDNDLLEALRLHEEREAAATNETFQYRSENSLMSSRDQPYRQQLFPSPASSSSSYSGGVIRNGATHHSLNVDSAYGEYGNSNYNNYSLAIPANKTNSSSTYTNYEDSNFLESANRNLNYSLNTSAPSSAVVCLCGLTCSLLTSRQEKSLGCTFYSCPKDKSDGGNCGFFQWENGPTANNFTISSEPQRSVKYVISRLLKLILYGWTAEVV